MTEPATAPAAPAAAEPARPVTETALPGPGTHADSLAYVTTGNITADMLINGRLPQLEELTDKIVAATIAVQDRLKELNKAGDIEYGRANPHDRAEVISMIDRETLKYISRENIVRGEARKLFIAAVINEIVGLGPIEPLARDPRITEIMVNGPHHVYVEIDGREVFVPGARFRDSEHLLHTCNQILNPIGRSLDIRNPLEDGRLGDGSRVNAVHHAVAPEGPFLTIRRFPEKVWTMKDLIENGSVDEKMACELAYLVYYKCSTLVAGGTGAGKTSLLNALSSCIPRDQRVITIEDSMELRLHPDAHVIAMESRPAGANGEGGVPIRLLVKNALRMKPKRIVVGEVRDAVALDMLQACNTGHDGSLSTIHANDAGAAMERLKVLVAQGGDIPASQVGWLIADALDLIVFQRQYEDGTRRVQSVHEIPSLGADDGSRLATRPLWEWKQTGVDDNGKFIGEYVRLNDISEELRMKRRLDHFKPFTMTDVMRMSELPKASI